MKQKKHTHIYTHTYTYTHINTHVYSTYQSSGAFPQYQQELCHRERKSCFLLKKAPPHVVNHFLSDYNITSLLHIYYCSIIGYSPCCHWLLTQWVPRDARWHCVEVHGVMAPLVYPRVVVVPLVYPRLVALVLQGSGTYSRVVALIPE